MLNFYEKVAEEVSRRVKESNRKKVLEIGSSTGEFLQFLKKVKLDHRWSRTLFKVNGNSFKKGYLYYPRSF